MAQMEYERGNWLFQTWEQWSQLAPGYNWRTFHLIKIELEDDRSMGGVEATVVVLGFGVRVRWNYKRTELLDEIVRRADEVVL